MAKFGAASLAAIATLHPDLQRLCFAAIHDIDFKVICGHRDEAAQERAFQEHRSDKHWPDSKHNGVPSKAMDVMPCPEDWEDRERFCFLAGVLVEKARQLGIKLRWGNDWDMDMNFKEHKLHDLPHLELVD